MVKAGNAAGGSHNDRTTSAVGEVTALTLALMRQSASIVAGLARSAGLAVNDTAALRALDILAPGDLTAGTLAERLGLSTAATTGLVDRLERAGLAQRSPDPGDRRRVLISLTPHARTFGEEYLAPFHRQVVTAAAPLPEDHLLAIRAFLAALVAEPEATWPLPHRTDPTGDD